LSCFLSPCFLFKDGELGFVEVRPPVRLGVGQDRQTDHPRAVLVAQPIVVNPYPVRKPDVGLCLDLEVNEEPLLLTIKTTDLDQQAIECEERVTGS
jgi:hypothetical protein